MSILSILGLDDVTRTSRGTVRQNDGKVVYSEVWKGPLAKAETKYDTEEGNNQWDTVRLQRAGGSGIVTLGKDVSVGLSTPGSTVSGTTPDSTVESELERWEIIGQDIYKNIRQQAKYNKAADQAKLERAREAFERGDTNFNGDTLQNAYIALLRKGVSEYLRSAVILQRSLSTTTRSELVASWTGVDRAWTLEDTAGSPNPPSEVLGAITDMPDHDATKYQWLKRAPQIRITVGQSRELTQQWIFAESWEAELYIAGNVE